jgi:hypothetical protein
VSRSVAAQNLPAEISTQRNECDGKRPGQLTQKQRMQTQSTDAISDFRNTLAMASSSSDPKVSNLVSDLFISWSWKHVAYFVSWEIQHSYRNH